MAAEFGPGTLQTYSEALKELYLDFVPENVTLKKKAALALMPKSVGFEGKGAPVPLVFSNPQGTSADFTVALSQQTPSSIQAFQMVRAPRYSVASLTGELYMASKSSIGSFLSAMPTELDNAFLDHTQDIHVSIFGDGTGALALIASVSNVATPFWPAGTNFQINLLNPTDARRFSYLESLDFSLTSTQTSPNYSAQISGLDGNAGILYVTTIAGGPPTNAMTIYRLGNRGFASNIQGYEAWIPTLPPASSDNFLGVNRSLDVRSLCGQVLNARGASVWDAVTTLTSQVNLNGGSPNLAILHNYKWNELQKSLGSQVIYNEMSLANRPNVYFKALVLNTDYGEINVVADPLCPINTIYVLQQDTWTLFSLGSIPHVIDDDGLWCVRASNADAIQVRLRSFSSLICKAPGYNGKALL